MDMHISQNARSKIEKAVVITGTGRSGTTIIGKIIHSFQSVEYVFEPPVLVTLFSLIDKMPHEQWKLIYETYLYEEILINSICGRSINCNQKDDSSIYKVKLDKEIESRLNRSLRKEDAEHEVKKHNIAYKIPSITHYIPNLLGFYPNSRVVVVKRDPIGTINSLMHGKWLGDINLKSNNIWPFRIHKGLHVPDYVKESDNQKWIEMTELDRCAYYYIRISQGAEKIKNKIEISYDELIDSPSQIIDKIVKKLNLQYGPKTESIIKEIKPTRTQRDYSILTKISPALSDLVSYYSG